MLAEAVRAVREGGVIALPFERLFGLAAHALDGRAVDRAAAIKKRDGASSPIAVIIPQLESLSRVASDFPATARELAERFWPGPLTLLLPAIDGLPAPLVSASGRIGVRLPGECPAAELARASELVLTATSANPSGGPDARTDSDLAALEGVDLLVPGAVPGPPGSTVVDAAGPHPVVIRPGVVDISARRP
ncbi:MAG: L-threonylcarbamoyladenylate synthase [Polyangia bacterium]